MNLILVLLWIAVVASAAVDDFSPGDLKVCQQQEKKSGLVQQLKVLPGVGWDNLQNIQKGQVIQFSYTKCLTTADGKFFVPDQVSANDFKDSIAEQIEIISWNKISSVTSSSVNHKAGLFSSGYTASGYYSDSNIKMKEKQFDDKATSVQLQLRYLKYKSLLNQDFKLHPHFKTRLLSIAGSLQLNQTEMAYYEGQLLVRDYGTHVITNAIAGAGLVKTDFLKRNYIESRTDDQSQIFSSARLDFLKGYFDDMSTSLSNKENSELLIYEKSLTHSSKKEYGGPLIKPGKPSMGGWTASIDTDLVAMDRSGDPLSYLVTKNLLPELPINIVSRLKKVVLDSIVQYYQINTHYGCTKLGSTNFTVAANVDDGTCDETAADLNFGGVFQTCKVHGQYVDNNNPCMGLTQKHLQTGNYSCPSQYKAVELVRGTKISVPASVQECERNVLKSCDTSSVQVIAEYNTYWCVAPGPVTKESGYLFGGIFSNSEENPITYSKECPPSFDKLQFMDRYICISDNFEAGRPNSAPFGGFFSCMTGNPLAWHKGLKNWPMHCPAGYSRHLVAINTDCAVNYCVKSGVLSRPALPKIKVPPFYDMSNSVIINIETTLKPTDVNGVKENPGHNKNSSDPTNYEDNAGESGGISTEIAAGIGTGAAFLVLVFVVFLVCRRRKNRSTIV